MFLATWSVGWLNGKDKWNSGIYTDLATRSHWSNLRRRGFPWGRSQNAPYEYEKIQPTFRDLRRCGLGLVGLVRFRLGGIIHETQSVP